MILRLNALAALKSGLRGRTFHAVFFFSLLLLVITWLSAAFSARQPQAVALDVGLSGVRFSLTFLVLVWVQELVGREIERRTVFVVLAYPLPRSSYVMGRYLGILGLLFLAAIILGLMLRLVVAVSSWGYQYPHGLLLGWPYWITILGYVVDAAVVAALTLLVATVATSSILPLAVGAAFAVACRMLGPVFDYLSQGASGDVKLVERFGGMVASLRWVLPDLDRLDWRLWPLYGVVPDTKAMLAALLMATFYGAMLVVLAVHAFRRREFL